MKPPFTCVLKGLSSEFTQNEIEQSIKSITNNVCILDIEIKEGNLAEVTFISEEQLKSVLKISPHQLDFCKEITLLKRKEEDQSEKKTQKAPFVKNSFSLLTEEED
jgi:hypothetical protein